MKGLIPLVLTLATAQAATSDYSSRQLGERRLADEEKYIWEEHADGETYVGSCYNKEYTYYHNF